jgi:hypothetical protein
VVDKLELAPNPVKNTLHLNFVSAESNVGIQILNLTGRVVYEAELNRTKGLFKTDLDLGHLNSGIYFLQLSTKEGSLVKKIIKN